MLTIQTDSIPPALPPIAFVFKLNPLPPTVTPFLIPRINNPDFDILQNNPPGIVQFAQGNIGIAKTVVTSALKPISSTLDNLNKSTQDFINDTSNSIDKVKNAVKDAQDKLNEATKNIKNEAKNIQNELNETTNKIKVNEYAQNINGNVNDIITDAENEGKFLTTNTQNVLKTATSSLPKLSEITSNLDIPNLKEIMPEIPNIDTSKYMPSISDIANNAVPNDSGLLSFEKMSIQSMLETYKPAMEAVLIIIDMLAIIEDAIARFLGTSIKIPIIKVWIGIPSKKPYYTKGALNYDGSDALNKEDISKENVKALNEVLNTFKETANIYGGIPGGTLLDINEYKDNQQAYYIGYFDEDGNNIIPPTWVENSNKWFGKKWGITYNSEQPYQLSNEQIKGVQQLKDKYNKNIRTLEYEKNKLESNVSYAETGFQSLDNNNNGKEQALNLMQEFIDEVGNGVKQAVYPEWFTKSVISQLKSIYNNPYISTAEPVTDKKGKPKEPYVTFPKIHVEGMDVEITVVESENQLVRKKVKENGKKRKKIVGLNTETNNNGETIVAPEDPEDTDILYWNHKKVKSKDQQKIKQVKIPEEVKRYYLSHDFEIILDYEIREIKSQRVIRTEREIVPQSIDFEKDYKLRLIRVINKPTTKDFKLFDKTFSTKADALSYMKNNLYSNVNKKTGTAYAENNTIPEQYDLATNGQNKHSANVLDKNNNLYEGEIMHGVDPRYNGFRVVKKFKKNADGKKKAYYKIEQYKYQVFWLVEAIKLNDDGTFNINGELYDENKDNSAAKESGGGKKWYGLLDKFTVIILIITKLIPIIARKFIPLIIKILRILTDPRALADLVFLIITEKLSKLFGMFDTKFSNKSAIDKAQMKGNNLTGKASKFHYKNDKMKNPINVADGKQSVEIFGFFIGIAAIDGELKLYYSKKSFEKDTKDLPESGLINFILKIIKLPFDIIEAIIKFFIDFVKKLVNPFTMLKAIIEFITFKWLIKILTASLDDITSMLKGNFDKYGEILNSKNDKDMNNEILTALQGEEIADNFIKVFVYNVFVNGKFVREEIEEKPIDNQNIHAQSYFPLPGIELDDDLKKILDEINPGNKEGPGNPPFQYPISCGISDIPLNSFIPSPFLCKSPNFNLCDIIQLYIKPLEQIFGFLSFIQGIIQGLIALPFSALGLSPYIPIPEFDFVTPIKEKVYAILKDKMPNIVPIENTDLTNLSEMTFDELKNKYNINIDWEEFSKYNADLIKNLSNMNNIKVDI